MSVGIMPVVVVTMSVTMSVAMSVAVIFLSSKSVEHQIDAKYASSLAESRGEINGTSRVQYRVRTPRVV